MDLAKPIDEVVEACGAPYISLNAVMVFKDDMNYLIVTYSGNIITGFACYSPDKELLLSEGFTPIDDEDLLDIANSTIQNVEDKYGKAPVDIGSGFYLPAYITINASIVFFHVQDDVIKCITSIDVVDNINTILYLSAAD